MRRTEEELRGAWMPNDWHNLLANPRPFSLFSICDTHSRASFVTLDSQACRDSKKRHRPIDLHRQENGSATDSSAASEAVRPAAALQLLPDTVAASTTVTRESESAQNHGSGAAHGGSSTTEDTRNPSFRTSFDLSALSPCIATFPRRARVEPDPGDSQESPVLGKPWYSIAAANERARKMECAKSSTHRRRPSNSPRHVLEPSRHKDAATPLCGLHSEINCRLRRSDDGRTEFNSFHAAALMKPIPTENRGCIHRSCAERGHEATSEKRRATALQDTPDGFWDLTFADSDITENTCAAHNSLQSI